MTYQWNKLPAAKPPLQFRPMLAFPGPDKLIIEIPVESVGDVRAQQSKDRLQQVDITRSGASLGVHVQCFGGEQVLSLGVPGDLANFLFDGLNAIHGAEGDGNRVGGVRGEERVEAVELFKVKGKGVEVDGLTDGVNVGQILSGGVFREGGEGCEEEEREEG